MVFYENQERYVCNAYATKNCPFLQFYTSLLHACMQRMILLKVILYHLKPNYKIPIQIMIAWRRSSCQLWRTLTHIDAYLGNKNSIKQFSWRSYYGDRPPSPTIAAHVQNLCESVPEAVKSARRRASAGGGAALWWILRQIGCYLKRVLHSPLGLSQSVTRQYNNDLL